MVLGSGLATAAETLEDARAVPYASLPGFPETTVAGHPGRLMVGTLERAQDPGPVRPGARLRGLLPPARSASACGWPPPWARTRVVVTNVSGGIDPTLDVGEIVGHLRSPEPDRRLAADRAQRRAAGAALRGHDRRLHARRCARWPARWRRRCSASRCARRSTPACRGRPTRRRPRCACCASWAPAWWGCRRSTR